MTQKEFAEKLEVSYQQLEKYERCVNRVSGSVLYRGAKVLGISETDLFPPLAGKEVDKAPRTSAPARSPRAGESPAIVALTPERQPPAPELEEFTDICDRILRLNSPRLKCALLAVCSRRSRKSPPESGGLLAPHRP